ncbi:MAG: hypothetical protein OXG72_07595, partial [Acidobacteria bacterium]|nr:hypothetical protein [Acidobacteriota bacterium]
GSGRRRSGSRRAGTASPPSGMVLAIEPMVSMGKPAVKVLRDGWTAVTRDGSLAAHFEHSVAVTADGPLVLSRPLQEAGASADGAAMTWALGDGA